MSSTPSRGRPATADPAVIAGVALELFESRGFDEVTMDDVAAACGVSRRTLFRLFPSKGELVWGGFSEVSTAITERLDLALSTWTPGTPVEQGLAELRHSITAGFDVAFDSDTAPLSTARLRLIGRYPALRSHGAPRLEQMAVMMRAPIARVLGRADDDPMVEVGSAAVFAALFAAILGWAQRGQGEPGDTIDAGLRLITGGLISLAE
ncbi:MAG: TetR family transcriptional regulator [Mycetocola sp.]